MKNYLKILRNKKLRQAKNLLAKSKLTGRLAMNPKARDRLVDLMNNKLCDTCKNYAKANFNSISYEKFCDRCRKIAIEEIEEIKKMIR